MLKNRDAKAQGGPRGLEGGPPGTFMIGIISGARKT